MTATKPPAAGVQGLVVIAGDTFALLYSRRRETDKQKPDWNTTIHSTRAPEKELALGYRCVHRSADAGNYARGDERVDLLYARRPAARQLLATATAHATPFGQLRVIGLAGLIAFKLQGLVNNPRRTQDLEDIRALLRVNRDKLNRSELREYFRLFDREPLLDELLAELD